MHSLLIDLRGLIPLSPSAFHENAWGKPWPRFNGEIYKADISDTKSSSAEYHVERILQDKLKVPPVFSYQFFKGIREIKCGLGAGPDTQNVLVIRAEYEVLLKYLEATKVRGLVITGHPGIGSYECQI